jgi:hypothetical protein
MVKGSPMTTLKEKVRKLRALAQSPDKHESALALEKAEGLESTIGTGKVIAHAIAQHIEARGLTVCVKRRRGGERSLPEGVDVVVRYCHSRSSFSHSGPAYEIEVREWEWTGREPDRARAKNFARAFDEMMRRRRRNGPAT